MGKRKKVDINGKPLDVITIGKVKDNKYGWIGTLILFGLFIAVIYYLPEITVLVDKYLNNSSVPVGNPTTPKPPVVNPPSNLEPSTKPDDILYALEETDEVMFESLKFSEIKIEGDVLSFTVTNTASSLIELKDIYLLTFDNGTDQRSTINTIAIKGKINKDRTKSYSFNIASGATYFTIKKILEADYTYIDIPQDETGKSILTCENSHRMIVYSFYDYKLLSVQDNINILNEMEDSDNLIDYYDDLIEEYETTPGTEFNRFTNADGYTYVFNVDYREFKGTIDELYFAKDVSPRVVNFIMEAELFDCQ